MYVSVPSKSLLQPPKLAPSAWQLYFTDWISRHQATNTRKLNVAQAAKEAGQEYALLTDNQKEVHTRSSLTSTLFAHFPVYSRTNDVPRCSKRRASGNSMRTCAH